MQSFKFMIPTVVFSGRNEFERAGKLARSTGKNALIVLGKGSARKHGYLDRLIDCLSKEGVKHTVFEGVEPNPRVKTVNAGGALARKNSCDFIIALGGGSVMDAAKGISVVAKTGGDIWENCGRRGYSPKRITESLPLICIPTLAATGSEVDSVAVISNWETQQKSVIHGESLFPKYAIVDPALTMTAPLHYVTDGAVDIICHCMETYLSSELGAEVQDFFTMGLVRSVKKAIEEVLGLPNMLVEGRDTLCWASSIAMTGILNGRKGGWPIHEIEHSLSGLYDISHGRGLALLMPAMLKFNLKYNSERIKRLIGFTLHENTNYYSDRDGMEAVCDLENWFKSINAIPQDLCSLCGCNVNPEEIAQITIDVYGNDEGNIFSIIPMGKKEIVEVLRFLIEK